MPKRELILGPPGTGKTTDLLRLVGEHIDGGVSPTRMAFVSFTRKAAHEAKDRALVKFPDIVAGDLPFFNTLHAIAFHRLHLRRADVLDRTDFAEISRRCGMEFTGYYDMSEGQPPSGSLEGDDYLRHHTLAGNKCITWDEHFESLPFDDRADMSKTKFRNFDQVLTAYKNETGKLDFNDFFSASMEMGPLDVDVAIIDEAQDLTRLQWGYVQKLFPDVPERYIAGDDDQSIYEWNGSDTETFLHLPDERRVLDRSYRLPENIFKYSQLLISRVKNRYEKKSTWDADRKGTVTFHEDFKFVEVNPNEDWLVLVRNAYHMADIASHFIDKGLHFAKRGKPMVVDRHLVAIRAWLDLSKGRAIDIHRAVTLYEHMTPVKEIKRGSRTLLADSILPRLDYEVLVDDYGMLVPQNTDWWDTLTRITPYLLGYYRRVLRLDQNLEKPPTINLSTIHGAKGGEAENVMVLNDLAWRTMKNFWRNEDEEHRVFFVAVTRAKENLHLVRSNGKNVYPWPKFVI